MDLLLVSFVDFEVVGVNGLVKFLLALLVLLVLLLDELLLLGLPSAPLVQPLLVVNRAEAPTREVPARLKVVCKCLLGVHAPKK